MSLLSNHENLGHLVDAIVHFNRGRDITGSSTVEVARILFDGLNKLQTQWVLDHSEHNLGEVKAFQSMILDSLHGEARSDLLRSNELRSVVAFEPKILNHDVLRHCHYRPGSDIEPSLFREASEVHRKLTNAFSEFDGGDGATEERVIKRTAELLYIVRQISLMAKRRPMDQISRNGTVTKPFAP